VVSREEPILGSEALVKILGQHEYWDAAASSLANDRLELTILPTEQCNLRCSYCYEKFQLGKMDSSVVSAIQRLMNDRADDLSVLKLDWFGGEPLIALDVIREIATHAQWLASTRPSMEYRSSATTNGLLLTKEVARELTSWGVTLFHVSLDGPKESHDRTRSTVGGRGTFNTLMRNLSDIRDSDLDLEIELRIHVTPHNAHLLDGFLDQLLKQFLYDPRFNAYFFPIVDLGGPKQGDFPILGNINAARIIERLTAKLKAATNSLSLKTGANVERKNYTRNADGRRIEGNASYVCYAAKPNAWVIRSDGRLAKCTVGFEDERNTVGRLLPDGSLDVAADKVKPWLRGWSTGNQLELHCPYEGMREDVRAGVVESRG